MMLSMVITSSAQTVSEGTTEKWKYEKTFSIFVVLLSMISKMIFLKPKHKKHIAKKESAQKVCRIRALVFGLIDVCTLMLFFLPLFADRGDGFLRSASLLTLENIQLPLKLSFWGIILITFAIGVLSLASQSEQTMVLTRKTSLLLSTVSTLLFVATLHPYAAIFCFALLIIKGLIVVKND